MKKYLSLLTLLIFATPMSAQVWTLDSCLTYATINNKDLLIKHKNSLVAEWDVKSTTSDLIPKLEASSAIDHYWKIPVQVFPGELLGQPEGSFVPVRLGTPWMGNYGFNASFYLINPVTLQNIKLVRLKKQATDYEAESFENTLHKNVTMAYFVAQSKKNILELSNKRLKDYLNIHDLIKQRFENGIIDKIAFNQSALLFAGRKNEVIKAENEYYIALIDLRFWMNYPMEKTLAIAAGEEIPLPSDKKFEASLLADYKTEETKVELAQQTYNLSKSEFLPSISLSTGYSKLGFGQSLSFVGKSEWFASGFVGLDIKIPILSLGDMNYRPKKEKVKTLMANLAFENYVLEQKRKFLTEKSLMLRSWETVRTEQENIKLVTENELLTRQKLEKGIVDLTELKQIELDFMSAHERLTTAQTDFLRHYVELNYLIK